MIGTTVSHYRILEKLGEGGMGVVYKSHDTILDRTVALKFLPSYLTSDPVEKERFYHEAKAAAALTHQNIAVIHEIGEHDGKVFIVMECVEGKTLRQILAHGPLSIKQVLDIAIQIADGLTAAHKKGIVHRDIKPENIIVADEGKIAKITDFGLAKLKGATKLTKAGSTLGTAAYMSPEQARGEDVDQRSDIFSVGVVFYEMLAGHAPFRGEHAAALMYSITNEEPAPLARYNEQVTGELQHIVSKALEKDRDDRYQHVDDMLSDLRRERKKLEYALSGYVKAGEAATAEGPLPAPPNSAVLHPKKRKSVFITAGILLIVLAGAAIAYFSSGGRDQSINSIAVLPFSNVTGDPNTEYLGDGISESLINSLSQLSNLSVMSSSAVSHFKGKDIDAQKAGQELGVKAVLTGKVIQHGEDLRIRTELVDVAHNTHLWGGEYNKKLADILAVQDEIANEISKQLSLKLAGEDEKKLTKHSTENTEAYQLYLKGRFHWNKRKAEDLQKAIDYFNQAIEKDPGYALAYAGLASAYVVAPDYTGLPEAPYLAKAEAAAKKALELDATLAEPHAVLGTLAEFRFDWAGAEQEFRKAIELDPKSPMAHHWYGMCLRNEGKLDEALTEGKRAQDLDPLSPVIGYGGASTLLDMRRYDQSIEILKKTLELDSNFVSSLDELGMDYAYEGKFDEAIEMEQRVRQILGPNDPTDIEDLGTVYAMAGKKKEANAVIDRMVEFEKQGYVLPVEIAQVYAALGEKDKVFERLEMGFKEQDDGLDGLKSAPYWDNLRSDPRYAALLKKIGLGK